MTNCEDAQNRIGVYELIREYRLRSDTLFPDGVCKIRIWRYPADRYFASANLYVIHPVEGGFCGFGKSEQDALDQAIAELFSTIASYESRLGRTLQKGDFGYYDPHEF